MNSLHNFLRSQMLPLKQIDVNIPKKGRVIELGCGEGIIATYLSKIKMRDVLGMDKNAKRLPYTSKKNLKFIVGDITKYNYGKINAVVISDVLHHLNYYNQKKVLKKIFMSLTSEGVLIIKEIDTQEFVRSRLSRLWDFIFYPKDKIYFNSSSSLAKNLEKIGFSVSISRPCRLFPGSTTLLICRK